MTLKDLAAALGISGPMVSRLVKRGMPTDSVERARRWRHRHLNPLQMKGQRIGSPPSPAPPASVPPAAPALCDDAVRHALALAELAADLLPRGSFASVEPLLRAALRAVPAEARASVEMAVDVWSALTVDVLRVCREFDDDARAAGEVLDVPTGDAAADLAPFWYAVAAGEVALSAPAGG